MNSTKENHEPFSRVLLVNQSFYPDEAATGLFFSDLAKYLVENGFDLDVITGRGGYKNSSLKMSKAEVWEGVRISRCRKWQPKFENHISRAIGFITQLLSITLALMRHRKVGLIVVGTSPPFVFLPIWLVAKIRGIPVIIWNMDVFPDVLSSMKVLSRHSILFRCLSRVRKFVLNRSNRIVSLGSSMTAYLIRIGIDQAKISTIPLWSPDYDEQVPFDYTAAWQLSGKKVILYSGNLGQAHRYKCIYDAVLQLKDDAIIQFVIVGSGAGYSKLKSLCEHSGLRNVSFYSHQPFCQVVSLLKSADIHLVTMKDSFEGLVIPSKIYGIAHNGGVGLFVGPESVVLPKGFRRSTSKTLAHDILELTSSKEANNEGFSNRATSLEMLHQLILLEVSGSHASKDGDRYG